MAKARIRVIVLVAAGVGLVAPQIANADMRPLFLEATTYSGSGLIGAGFGPDSIATADFNGDRAPDVAVASWTFPTGVFVYTNRGDGTFARPKSVAPLAGLSGFSVVTADIDGDGDADLAAANAATQNVVVLRNRGNAMFDVAGSYLSLGSPHDMITADFDNDGDADLAVTNPLGGTVTILLGNGRGGFNRSTVAAPTPASIASGDLNGDGHPDLVTFGSYAGTANLLLGDGRGRFTTGTPFKIGGVAEGEAIGDVNLDGDADLAVALATGDVVVALGHGDGTFSPPNALPVGPVVDVAIADLDHDAVPDLAVSDSVAGVVILTGHGDGTFAIAERHKLGAAQSVVVTDLNRDGEPDLALSTMTPKMAVLLHTA